MAPDREDELGAAARAFRRVGPWAAVAAVCGAGGLGLQAIGLPAPWLVAGLLGGLAVAVARRTALAVPRPLTVVAQAAVGVALGAQVRPEALTGVADAWWIVLGVVALTLGMGVAVALALARLTDLDRLTAAIGMLPGAAPALIAVGDEVGADARLVATMQFGRVLLVVATVPLLVLALGAGDGRGSGGAPGAGAATSTAVGLVPLLMALGVGVVGALVARLARAPAATLVGPLLLAALVGGTGIATIAVPPILTDAAFALVGATVGLRFDRASLRHAGRLVPAMAGALIVLTLGSAALGALLLGALGTDPLTAYLATVPGGISAVLAAAFDSGADLTVVVAVQTLRLVLLALVAPFAAHLLRVDTGP